MHSIGTSSSSAWSTVKGSRLTDVVSSKKSLRLYRDGLLIESDAFISKARVATRVDSNRQRVFVNAVVFGALSTVDLMFNYTYEAEVIPCSFEDLVGFYSKTKGRFQTQAPGDCPAGEFLKERFSVGVANLFVVNRFEPVLYHANLSLCSYERNIKQENVGGPIVSKALLMRLTTEEMIMKKNNKNRKDFLAVVFGRTPDNTPVDVLYEFSHDVKVHRCTFDDLVGFCRETFQLDAAYVRKCFPDAKHFFRIERFDLVLHNVNMRLSREAIVFNKNWSGKMFAKTYLEPVGYGEADEDSEDSEDDEDDDIPDSSDSGVVVSRARLTVVDVANVLKTKKKKQINAIVFGESPVKMLCDFIYNVQVERCSLEDLVDFYKENFGEDGQYAFNFSSAYRAKKTSGMLDNFFSGTEIHEEDGLTVVRSLRNDPEKLFWTHFASEISGTNGLANIFRIVRFSHIERDAFPQTISTIRKRFPAPVIGMEAGVYKKWIDKMGKLLENTDLGRSGKEYKSTLLSLRKLKENGNSSPLVEEEKKKLSLLKTRMRKGTEPFYKNRDVMLSVSDLPFLTQLDRRAMQDNLKFLATCPNYWKVARDFPSQVMDYMLKRCDHTVDCAVCTEMLKFHRQNISDGAIDRMLYPDSPWLKKQGRLPFSKNLLLCSKKWKLFARFPKLAAKYPPTAIQRAMLFKYLIDMRKHRARTTFVVKDEYRKGLELMEGSTGPFYFFYDHRKENENEDSPLLFFLNPCDPVPKDSDAVLECLEGFLSDVLKKESLVRIDTREFALAYDFKREFELYLRLRHSSTKVYEDLLPLHCSDVLFPNHNLKKILPEGSGGYRYNASGPVCIAFARRWRVCDLLDKMKKIRQVLRKEFILHVDTQCDIFDFDTRDDLQDWFSAIYRKEKVRVGGDLTEVFVGPDPLPSIKEEEECIFLSLKGVSKCEKKKAKSMGDLKRLMDMAVEGKCFLLCNIEKKRKQLLKESEQFRSGMNRNVLYRNFPKPDCSSYNLFTKPYKELNGEEEATITLPTRMNVFCPREEVYCIGDNWTPERRRLANHLVKRGGTVYELELVGDDDDFKKRFQYWHYNDAEVNYKNKTKNKYSWDGVSYNGSAFASIHKFVDRCIKDVDSLRAEKRREESKEDKTAKLRRDAREQQRKRDERRKIIEEERADANAKRARLEDSVKSVKPVELQYV